MLPTKDCNSHVTARKMGWTLEGTYQSIKKNFLGYFFCRNNSQNRFMGHLDAGAPMSQICESSSLLQSKTCRFFVQIKLNSKYESKTRFCTNCSFTLGIQELNFIVVAHPWSCTIDAGWTISYWWHEYAVSCIMS